MNNDLISREALKKRLQDRHDFWVNAWGGFSDMPLNDKSRVDELSSCIAEVVNAPTVELFCSYLSDGEVRQPCVEGPCEAENPQDDIFPMEIVAGKCPIEANGNCPLKPQGEWTPVGERLPIRNGVYNVTRIIDGTRITDACYFDGQNTWHRDTGVNHGRPYLTDIIAWQPLPEPYKKGGTE